MGGEQDTVAMINVRRGLALQALGLALPPVYAALNFAAIRMGEEAQRRGPNGRRMPRWPTG